MYIERAKLCIISVKWLTFLSFDLIRKLIVEVATSGLKVDLKTSADGFDGELISSSLSYLSTNLLT